MNLNELWSGNDYAFYENRGRGENFRWRASRVKIIRTFQKQLFGNERKSGFAEVLFVDKETGEPLEEQMWDSSTHSYIEVEKVREIRARDIAMRWDEYADEYDHRDVERQAAQAREQELFEQRRREREARLAAEAEERRIREEERLENERLEQERLAKRQEAVTNALLTRGIPLEAIGLINDYSVTLHTKVLERMFEIV